MGRFIYQNVQNKIQRVFHNECSSPERQFFKDSFLRQKRISQKKFPNNRAPGETEISREPRKFRDFSS